MKHLRILEHISVFGLPRSVSDLKFLCCLLQDEETYVFSGELNGKNLSEFLNSVANRSISRWLKSTEDASLYLNRYNNVRNSNPNEVAVLELHSGTFQSVVFNLSQVTTSRLRNENN